MYPVETINYLLSLSTVAMQIAVVAFLALFLLRKKFPDLEDNAAMIGDWGLWLGFLFSAGGIVLSLFYSEVLGFASCGLCWLQRVFLYPQAVLFAVALWKKDTRIADYSIALSVVGGLSALYHHLLQVMPAGTLPCPATGPSCAQITLFEFGYITYPLMAFSLFAFLIIVMLFVRKRS